MIPPFSTLKYMKVNNFYENSRLKFKNYIDKQIVMIFKIMEGYPYIFKISEVNTFKKSCYVIRKIMPINSIKIILKTIPIRMNYASSHSKFASNKR